MSEQSPEGNLNVEAENVVINNAPDGGGVDNNPADPEVVAVDHTPNTPVEVNVNPE